MLTIFQFIATIIAGKANSYELVDVRETISEYENGNPNNISVSLYNTLKSELANTESVLENSTNF